MCFFGRHRGQASSHRGVQLRAVALLLIWLLILISGAPLNHAGRRQVLRSGHPGMDAGVAATRPWMADRGGPTEQCLTAGMPSLGEAPSGGARVFCLLSRSTKVSRCKGGTNSRHYKKRICTQSRPIAEQCYTHQTPSAVAAPSQYSCASKAARHRSYPQSFHSQALPHPLHPQN